MKLNLPNKLTILRIILVPLCGVFIFYPVFGEDNEFWTRAVAAAIFLLTTLTDTFDGILARRYNQVTDFGKFLDPVADKFMVFTVFIAMSASNQYAYLKPILFWTTIIVVFRELAVTSMRLVVCKDNVVVAASWLGKVKTFTQCVSILVIILDPVVFTGVLLEYHIFSWIAICATIVTTVASGVDYFKTYAGFLDPTK